jgi:hypothetical protein
MVVECCRPQSKRVPNSIPVVLSSSCRRVALCHITLSYFFYAKKKEKKEKEEKAACINVLIGIKKT